MACLQDTSPKRCGDSCRHKFLHIPHRHFPCRRHTEMDSCFPFTWLRTGIPMHPNVHMLPCGFPRRPRPCASRSKGLTGLMAATVTLVSSVPGTETFTFGVGADAASLLRPSVATCFWPAPQARPA